LKDGSGGE